MKKLLIVIPLIATAIYANDINSSLEKCKEIAKLNIEQKSTKKPEQILLKIGNIASTIEDVELKEFNKTSDYKNICHLKVVKSQNFGDFVAY